MDQLLNFCRDFLTLYVQAYTKQEEVLSILTSTENPQKMPSYVTARGLSKTALFAI